MHDDERISSNPNPDGAGACDPLQTASQDSDRKAGEETAAVAEALESLAPLSADPTEDPDPDPSADPQETAADGLEQLRRELTELRDAFSRQSRMLERLGKDCEEFSELYPNTSLSELPDAVWEEVRRGIPLAAAYALSERRRKQTEEMATESNLENSRRSSGALDTPEPDYFSPREVRAMSQADVRKNYQKIMKSMQKWK